MQGSIVSERRCNAQAFANRPRAPSSARRAKILHCQDTGLQSHPRPESRSPRQLVRGLERLLQPETSRRPTSTASPPARSSRASTSAAEFCALAIGAINASSFFSAIWPACACKRQNQPVLANRKANPRSLRPPDHLRKPVIPTAAQQSILRTQPAHGLKLEGRPRVVVQSANQPMASPHTATPQASRAAHTCRKVRLRLLIQIIRNRRQRLDNRLVFRTLQSSTRSGFVSARRWQSPHICGATARQRLS